MRGLKSKIAAVAIGGAVLVGAYAAPALAAYNVGYATMVGGSIINTTYGTGAEAQPCAGRFSCSDTYLLLAEVVTRAGQPGTVVASNYIVSSGSGLGTQIVVATYDNSLSAALYGCFGYYADAVLYDYSTSRLVDVNQTTDC